MSNQIGTPEATSEDKLWAALAYVFTPLVPVIIMLMEDKKNRPFIRAHNMQALALGIVFWVVAAILAATIVGNCVWPFGFILLLYYAYKAYQGQYITIPVISDFVQKQGWA